MTTEVTVTKQETAGTVPNFSERQEQQKKFNSQREKKKKEGVEFLRKEGEKSTPKDSGFTVKKKKKSKNKQKGIPLNDRAHLEAGGDLEYGDWRGPNIGGKWNTLRCAMTYYSTSFEWY